MLVHVVVFTIDLHIIKQPEHVINLHMAGVVEIKIISLPLANAIIHAIQVIN